MALTVRSRVVKIGNSRGIRIPRALLEQAGLTEEVELSIQGNKLIIQSVRQSRKGWETHFANMAKNGDDRLLEETTPTRWDEEDWVW